MKQLLFLCLLLTIASCTVEKRLYRPGYHIGWKKFHRSSPEETSPEKAPFVPEEHVGESPASVPDLPEAGSTVSMVDTVSAVRPEPEIIVSQPDVQHSSETVRQTMHGKSSAFKAPVRTFGKTTIGQFERLWLTLLIVFLLVSVFAFLLILAFMSGSEALLLIGGLIIVALVIWFWWTITF